MAYTQLEYKSIDWYMKANNLKLEGLSLRPQIRFRDAGGNIVERNVSNLLAEFQKARQQDSKENARIRRAEKARSARK